MLSKMPFVSFEKQNVKVHSATLKTFRNSDNKKTKEEHLSRKIIPVLKGLPSNINVPSV